MARGVRRALLGVGLVGVLALVFGALSASGRPPVPAGTAPAAAARPLTPARRTAVVKHLLTLLREQDEAAAFAYMRHAIRTDASIARECHPLLHHLGRAAFAKHQRFSEALAHRDDLCNSAYTHGVIEGYLGSTPDIHTALRTACAHEGDPSSFRRWQCDHGIGHGIMYFTGKDLRRSLTLCESLESAQATSSCANGVYMERFIVVSHDGRMHAHGPRTDLGVCATQPGRYRSTCYVYAPSAYLALHPNDYAGAFRQCAALDLGDVDDCVNGVGGQAMKDNVTRPAVARDRCRRAPQGYVTSCVAGAVDLLLNDRGDASTVAPLCSTTFAANRDVCVAVVRAWTVAFA